MNSLTIKRLEADLVRLSRRRLYLVVAGAEALASKVDDAARRRMRAIARRVAPTSRAA